MMPFIVVSKTNVLVMIAQSLIIFYLIYQHIRLKINKLRYFIGLFLIVLIVPTFIGSENQTKIRFEQALDVLKNPMAHTNASTSARIGEIKGVLHNFSDAPLGVIFGMGNGSWVLAKFVDNSKGRTKNTGLAAENYREKGKYVHHIHSGIFAILNRNGLIGLLAYSYFFYYVFRFSKKLISFGRVRYLNYSKESRLVYLYGLGSVVYLGEIIALIPNNAMYGSLFWGAKVAMIPIAFWYLNLHKVGKG
jgi:O-antigen ligase